MWLRRMLVIVALWSAISAPKAAHAQFETRFVFPVGVAQPFSLAVGDFNRDGITDIAVVNVGGAGSVDILLGNGDGTFTLHASYEVAVSYNIATASLRNNGVLDLVVAGTGSDDYVSVMLGNGDGTFQPPVPYPATAGSNLVGLGNFTGSGNIDIINLEATSSLGVACDCIQLFPGNGDGTFGSPITTYITNMYPGAFATGDFNQDGKLDIVVSGAFFSTAEIDILLGNGDGTFTNDGSYVLSGGGAVATGYFTPDKTRIDLAIGNGGGVGVLLGNGDGTFQPPVYYETGGYSTWVIAQDVDGDGVVDLATSDAGGGPPGGASVFKGNGDGTFQAGSLYPLGHFRGAQYIGAADFNDDGKTDLVLVGGEQVITLLNTGSATFSPTSPLTFFEQLIGTTSDPQTVTVTNSGTTAMTFSSVTASGAPFRMTANTCKGSLAPGAQCAISAEFTAKTLGTVSGGITINDSASTKPQFVELIGIGTEAAISPPRLLKFPPQKVRTTSPPRTVHITNTGTKNMGFTHFIYIDGGDAPFDFKQTNDCGKFLAPKASCTVTIRFKPSQTGERGSILYFNDDGGDSPQTVFVYGTGESN
ncbi:MAG TPA: FG-GAP-like repeat-containing protein [Candidatus Binatia bacterium]|nr:FG-GAP-like repeat-containing protein [Candidatus Binatia bacterium]